MAENLVVVESPAKAKTINKYLGKTFIVKASLGHVKDLPKSRLGVDVDAGFVPSYVTLRSRVKVLRELKAEAKKAKHVFLATDPDREGEAIGWHLASELKTKKNDVRRVRFHEITQAAVLAAVGAPGPIDQNLVDAQQARRVLDRLVGYGLSPFLWKCVRRGLSAGRVQSVAVRLLCEREDGIESFQAVEYWDVRVTLRARGGTFSAALSTLGGAKAERLDAAQAAALGAELPSLVYVVASVARTEQRRFAFPPFTTSTLQQEAAKRLRFTAKHTMAVAQKLYEGLSLGAAGTHGLITYMRTDSVRVAPEAQREARALIATRFGAEYLPAKAPFYKTKRPGQDAHEAVRPTLCARIPEDVARQLAPEQAKLYGLIWRRFVASQMAPALFDATSVEVLAPRPTPAAGVPAGDALFKAAGSVERFGGFLAAYRGSVRRGEAEDQDDGRKTAGNDSDGAALPAMSEGEALAFLGGAPERHFTQAPARFNDASLVKTLEEQGIGRPSTYAPIISTILDRLYVERIPGGGLKPTELGRLTNTVLVKHFPGVLDVRFTAHLEGSLDGVEDGSLPWKRVLADFYGPFSAEMEAAKAGLGGLRLEMETVQGVACEKCGASMALKWGRQGRFLACSNYPACRGTRPVERTPEGVLKAVETVASGESCPKCGQPMEVKRGRFGAFLGCSGYPHCKTTGPLKKELGIACPKCATGKVRARRSKRGRIFYGCDHYPDCDFVSSGKPVDKRCPNCGSTYLVQKSARSKASLICAKPGCGYCEAAARTKGVVA